MGKRGNGEGTITHNKARGRWEGRLTVRLDDDGSPVRRKVTGATRADVVRRLKELANANDTGATERRADLTVGQYLEDWLTDVLPGTVTRGTEANYAFIARRYVKPHLGRKRLRSLSAADVTRMLRDLEDEGLSPNTRRLARSVLRRALRRAEAERIVDRNVAALADGVRIPAQRGRTLTPEEVRAFLSSVEGDRYEAAYWVMAGLGLRRGELLALSWDDVDLRGARPKLTVRGALKRLPDGLSIEEAKTQQSHRTVYLPAPVAEVLRSHRKRQAAERLAAGNAWERLPFGEDLVFRTPRGTAVDPDNFRNHTYRRTEAAGIGRLSPHKFRHVAASLLLAQGVPLKTVSEVLGHSSIRVTADVYSHLMEPAKAEAADAMTLALNG